MQEFHRVKLALFRHVELKGEHLCVQSQGEDTDNEAVAGRDSSEMRQNLQLTVQSVRYLGPCLVVNLRQEDELGPEIDKAKLLVCLVLPDFLEESP